VRKLREQAQEHASEWAAIRSVAAKVGCAAEMLRQWVRQAERGGLTSEDRARLQALERENRELRQANEILRQGQRVFCGGGARPPVEAMIALIDDHPLSTGSSLSAGSWRSPRQPGVPMPRAGPIHRKPRRARRDALLRGHVRWVCKENFPAYGVRKVLRQLGCEGSPWHDARSPV
jgi:transposase-like protein